MFMVLVILSSSEVVIGAPPETPKIPAVIDLHPEDHQNKKEDQDRGLIITNDALMRDPELAARFLSQAVEDEQWSIVRSLLSMYREIEPRDTVLQAYAEGALARYEGDYNWAVKLYRQVLSERPDLIRVRLDLARMLFENRQYEAARYQFEKARAEHLPDVVLSNLQGYLEALDRVDSWSGSMEISYLDDNNINNASSSKYVDIGGRRFSRNADGYPQKGHGVSYGTSLRRDLRIVDHHSVSFQAQLLGRSYWDNHKYDDLISRIYMGYSYSDAEQRFLALPFYEKRWYGTDPYSFGAGVRAEYSKLLSPNWQVSSALEYQRLSYNEDRYRYLDGHGELVSGSLGYAFSSRLALYAGLDLGRQNTRSESDSSSLAGVRLGLEAELPFGVSTSFLVSGVERVYDRESDIFSIRRRDLEGGYILTLWHRRVYFMGVMPKLNFSYRSVSSNIDYYSYDQRKIYLTLTKAF